MQDIRSTLKNQLYLYTLAINRELRNDFIYNGSKKNKILRNKFNQSGAWLVHLTLSPAASVNEMFCRQAQDKVGHGDSNWTCKSIVSYEYKNYAVKLAHGFSCLIFSFW